jgi:SAM-dependent methyltransferase
MHAPQTSTYAFANARARQQERLGALEALLDPGTVRHLEALGVGAGWRCLEVGAGGGSVARWLCARVGPTGHVTATDLDTRFVAAALADHANARVIRHDVLADDLPERSFDLIHARLLLAWLADPRRALARLVAALRPGGWLVAEEMDFVSVVAAGGLDGDTAALVGRVVGAHNAVLARNNTFDAAFGRRLPGELEQSGLVDVRAEGRVGLWRGGDAGGRVWRLSGRSTSPGSARMPTTAGVEAIPKSTIHGQAGPASVVPTHAVAASGEARMSQRVARPTRSSRYPAATIAPIETQDPQLTSAFASAAVWPRSAIRAGVKPMNTTAASTSPGLADSVGHGVSYPGCLRAEDGRAPIGQSVYSPAWTAAW